MISGKELNLLYQILNEGQVVEIWHGVGGEPFVLGRSMANRDHSQSIKPIPGGSVNRLT